MFDIIELDANDDVVDVWYSSSTDSIGVILDRARRIANETGKHIIVEKRTIVNDGGLKCVDDDLNETIWDSKGFLGR